MRIENILVIKLLVFLTGMFLLVNYTLAENLPNNTVLKIKFSTELSQLQEIINAQIPQHLHTIQQRNKGPCVKLLFTKACADIDINGWVKRNGKITVTHSNNSLLIKIPVKGNVKARGTGEIGKHIRESANAEMELVATIKPEILDNWVVKVNLTASYKWIKAPSINIAGIRITFKEQVDSSISIALKNATADLEREIAKKFIVKEEVRQIWDSLFIDLLLNQDVLLKIRPIKAYVNPFTYKDNKAITVIELQAKTEVFYNAEINKNIQIKKLPTLSKSSLGSSIINVPVIFNNDTFLSKLNSMSEDQDFKIKELSFFKTTDKSRVKIKLKIKINSWYAFLSDDTDYEFTMNYSIVNNKLNLSDIALNNCTLGSVSCSIKSWLANISTDSKVIFAIDLKNEMVSMESKLKSSMNDIHNKMKKKNVDFEAVLGTISVKDLAFTDDNVMILLSAPLNIESKGVIK